MNLIRRLFPFRTCTIDIKEGQRALPRPCLLYHIKRCQGPCIEAISKDDYRADIDQVMLFLEGRQEQVARRLREDMSAASDATDYERAADMRDKLRAIERTMEGQKMAAFARTEMDVLGFARPGQRGGRPAVRHPRRHDRRARRVPARERRRLVRRRGALRVHQAVLRRDIVDPATRPGSALPPDRAELVAFLEARRGRRVELECRSAARAAS